MTYPVFASGDVLNASDMNAVGLWLVKSQTIGNAVSSVQVTSAFSTDYEHYLITVNGGTASTGFDLRLQIGNATTGYYASLIIGNYANTTLQNANLNNAAHFTYAGHGTTDQLTMYAYVFSPFLTQETQVFCMYSQVQTNGVAGLLSGYLNNNTSYTDFTISPPSGTMTGGTIRVYGVKK